MMRMATRRAFGKGIAASVALSSAGLLGMQASPRTVSTDLQFSLMIWTLSRLGSFEQNLEQVAQAGYQHVELSGQFEKWSAADTVRYLARMRTLGLTIDATSGLSASFCDPAGEEIFLSKLKEFLPKVERLECKQIILLSGKRIEDAPPGAQQNASVDTLKRAVHLLEDAGMTALIEPIDRLENPPIYLDTVMTGFDLANAVASPRLKLLYDFYHEQRTHGNLLEKLDKVIDQIGLVHIADAPTRHQPGTGEIAYRNIYRELGRLRYKGVIAMEFYPLGDVVQTLRQAREEALRCYQEGAHAV